MPTNWIDDALDRLHWLLRGTAREHGDNSEAAAMVGAFVLAVVAFGFELTNPTLGIDDFTI